MTSTHDGTTPTRPRRPWQYSMKTLFRVTFGTAVALAVVVSSPNAIAVPVMICLNIAVPAFLTVVLVYGSGYQRTFCIGALFPTWTALYATGWLLVIALMQAPPASSLDTLDGWLAFFDAIGSTYRVCTGGAWLLAVVGSAAVGVRWHLETQTRREKKEP